MGIDLVAPEPVDSPDRIQFSIALGSEYPVSMKLSKPGGKMVSMRSRVSKEPQVIGGAHTVVERRKTSSSARKLLGITSPT